MAPESVSVSLVELPDDVLLMVLQLLTVEDLLACRMVCRRLGGLALDRDLWRHRTLTADDPFASAVLLQAPSLKKVTVIAYHLLPLVTTRCAIEHLTIQMDGSHDLDLVALVVRRQEELGGLRHLDLPELWRMSGSADALLRTLAASSTLESLELSGGMLLNTTGPFPCGLPSLKRFGCTLTDDSHPFVDAILAGHATTLESVYLHTHSDYNHAVSRDVATSQLLASMPKLQKLGCGWLYGMWAVAACESLTHLDIDGAPDRAAELLRRATQLHSISLHLGRVRSPERLIDALAVPGRSLTELIVSCGAEVYGTQYGVVYGPPVWRALPVLSQLSVLRLEDYDLDELLQAISVAAPALELLELRAWWGDRGYTAENDCPHAWLHSDSLKTLFLRKPSFHIVMYYSRYNFEYRSGVCWHEKCEMCPQRLDCHQEVVWGGVIGLHSHNCDHCSTETSRFKTKLYHKGPIVPKTWLKIQ